MLIDATAARSLAIVVILSNQEPKLLNAQYPLSVIDQGATWLVKGTPFDDAAKDLKFCQSHVIIRKTDAEIIDFGFSGRMALTREQEVYWQAHMNKEDFDRIFGPRTNFDPSQLGSTKFLDVNKTVHGGLINSPDSAIDYALVLLRLQDPMTTVSRHTLSATETAGIWHVVTREGRAPRALITISRETGKAVFESAHLQ